MEWEAFKQSGSSAIPWADLGVGITRDEDAFLQAASTSGIVEANRQISFENRVEVIGSGSLILPTEEPETISSHEDTSIDGSDDDDDDIRVDCTRLARYVDSYSRHEALRRWAILELVSRSSLGKLLAILRKDYKLQLPKDARTLTKSSSQVSIDGLPLFKSSNTQLWPILIKVEELVDAPVMLVGVFGGQAKPENIEQYLRPLVLEVNDLQQRGLQFGDKQVHFKLRAIVADSPARAYLKAVTSYTGKHGCLKCSCVGEYIKPENKVIFDSVNSAPRTDAGFRAKVDKDHHKSWRTPLEDINNFHLIEDVVLQADDSIIEVFNDDNFDDFASVEPEVTVDISPVQQDIVEAPGPSGISAPVRPITQS
ncbi:uncharacterized protein LOC131291487 [Anopheles ziemanni]|uniref:uncharacterized protein LOC131269832 n=1 Tax=Anopheles coustani TaxID=139045 RepID=UPI00265811D2|nr:uncharacterized protein LOC131269832 [Anopheles coustani]XP_058176689.1 uncharacterized protein LOC131291487 [Anopheles ziemanni]